ncbi:unnamed protein product [Caenorhabditis brenneri]
MRFCVLLLITVPITHQLLSYDWSLKKACEKMNGQFNQREKDTSTTGDTCSLKFKVATRDDDDSRAFCELYAPWRLLKVSRETVSGRHFTTCHVEATLTCAKGWWQMFGHCLMIPNKGMTYTRQEAEELCKITNPNAGIAFMHHKYIVGIWRRYFKGTGQIWVDATETWDQYIQKTKTVDGSALALAFTGKHYDFSVQSNSLIRIDPNVKLEVLCQYKPEMNPAEINYLGRRYSEIYYPTIPVNNGILVRTTSSYTRTSSNFEVCQKITKPFMFKPIAPFVPDENALEELGMHPKNLIYLTRSGAELPYDQAKMDETMCDISKDPLAVKHPNASIGSFRIKNFKEKSQCQNMLSTAIVHGKSPAELRFMSDSRSLPIWCKLGYAQTFIKDSFTTVDGFESFARENGELIAHKLFTTKVKYWKAKKTCKDNGAMLSGINSKEEADKLGELVKKAGTDEEQFWLGGKRRQECKHIDTYVKDLKSICSRNKVIVWEDNVAQEFFDDWWKDGDSHTNPSYFEGKQDCLTYVYGTPGWASAKSEGFLDDITCYADFMFFCAKKLKQDEKAPDGWV